jgi:Co/Zn/Cd efflux system component
MQNYKHKIVGNSNEIELTEKTQSINSIDKHEHVFLSDDHDSNTFRTWLVIGLCFADMVIEISCGLLFGSLALVADGIHMSTHVIAFFITASAYSYSRKYAHDERFVFGTGKIGELAAYTSAIILIAIAIYIFYDGINRFIHPKEVDYLNALPVAFLGLFVNIGSGLLLSMSCSPWCCSNRKNNIDGENDEKEGKNHHEMHHSHDHGHSHGHASENYEYDLNESLAETFLITVVNFLFILNKKINK